MRHGAEVLADFSTAEADFVDMRVGLDGVPNPHKMSMMTEPGDGRARQSLVRPI